MTFGFFKSMALPQKIASTIGSDTSKSIDLTPSRSSTEHLIFIRGGSRVLPRSSFVSTSYPFGPSTKILTLGLVLSFLLIGTEHPASTARLKEIAKATPVRRFIIMLLSFLSFNFFPAGRACQEAIHRPRSCAAGRKRGECQLVASLEAQRKSLEKEDFPLRAVLWNSAGTLSDRRDSLRSEREREPQSRAIHAGWHGLR